MFTPLPPARTGIAHYAAMLIPALREKVELEVVSAPADPATRPPGNPIYQLGNNPHHEWIYREAMKTPGVIVLHDIVLHHLIVEMTLAAATPKATSRRCRPITATWERRGHADGSSGCTTSSRIS